MAYERVNWENLPSKNTPVNADNLNKMDKGIKDLETETDTKLDKKQNKLTAGTGIEITETNIINNLNANYSTDEQVIGKWIDGKPLYRKTIRGTVIKNDETYTIDTISDLKEVIDVRGTVLAVGKYFTSLNTILNAQLQSILQVDAETGAVLAIFGKSFLSNKYTAIVEYTKNTD